MKPICINNNLKWINLTNIGEIWNVSSRIPSRKWKTISNRRFDGDQPRTHWISCHILLDKKMCLKNIHVENNCLNFNLSKGNDFLNLTENSSYFS